MGDDLQAAQRFVSTALEQMTHLLGSEARYGAVCLDVVANIKDGAAALHARGIARAAEDVTTAISENTKLPQIDGRLMTLFKLVSQYAEGLAEIAPTAQTTDNMVYAPDMAKLEAAHKQAQSILEPLLSLVKDPAQSSALQRIAQLSQDVTVERSTDVSLESLMPDIIDRLIAAARAQNKPLSVSYAANDIVLPEAHVSSIAAFIEDLGSALITQSLETTAAREARGGRANGHIGITAEGDAQALHINLECNGRPLPKHLNLASISTLQSMGADISTGATETGAVVQVKNIALQTQITLEGEAHSVALLEDTDLLQGIGL